LLPNYRRFFDETKWGDVTPIEHALDYLARSAGTQTLPAESECRRLAAECEAQAPRSEEFSALFTTSAQDAVFAVCSLLDYCAERKLDQVVLAARYAADSIDLYVQETEQMRPGDPALEAKILAHRLMQQELERQERDLAALGTGVADTVAGVLSRRATEDVFL